MNRSRSLRRKAFVAALASMMGISFAASESRAATAEEFFKGKTITMYNSGSPGGGYDIYARVLAEHLGRHIPGNPTFISKNMPAAGGIVLANYLYNQAPRDGSEIAGIHSSAMMDAITGNSNARYKPADFGWLGSITQEINICIAWHTTGIKTPADVQSKEFLIGAVTSTPTESTPRLLNEIAGTKFKIVNGYPNTHAVNLAIEQGEVGGICNGYNTIETSMAEALRDKKISLFLQVGAKKHPHLPDVPFVYDLVKDPKDLALLDFEMGRLLFGRPFLTPPGLPQDRLKTLRDAFWATMHDPAFLADAASKKLEVLPVDGPAVTEQLVKLQGTSPDVIKRSADIDRQPLGTSP